MVELVFETRTANLQNLFCHNSQHHRITDDSASAKSFINSKVPYPFIVGGILRQWRMTTLKTSSMLLAYQSLLLPDHSNGVINTPKWLLLCHRSLAHLTLRLFYGFLLISSPSSPPPLVSWFLSVQVP